MIRKKRQIAKYLREGKVLSVVGNSVWRVGSARKYLPPIFLLLSLILMPAGSPHFHGVMSRGNIPLIEIIRVVSDESVTVRTHNFPANQIFTATMGPMGSRGIGGIVVGAIDSGNGGTFEATFPIPQEMKGRTQIAIRLETSHAFPYFAYNWFWNNTTGSVAGTGGVGPPPTPGYTGIPTIWIISVERDQSVTFETNNFPAGQIFTVTMGQYGTRGIRGIDVGTLDSARGGTLTATFAIPAELHGLDRIAIRAETSHTYPYFAFNWFYNNTATVGGPGTGAPGPGVPPPGSFVIPTISITSVVADNSVTFQTHNYPPNQTFQVTMGPMGTRGVNGIGVGQFQSGAGGSFPVTMPIPPALFGSRQISIRAQTSHLNPYYSYNWFYNNTTP